MKTAGIFQWRYLTGIFLIWIFANLKLSAQDCTAHFEVNAGPDIDVCEGGTVMLNGVIGGDATNGVWRGGKGKFAPDRNKLNAEYNPAPEEIGNTVVLILVANNPKMANCPPGRSQIRIRVNCQPVISAGERTTVCAGGTATMKPSIKGAYHSLDWISNGSGKFDDAHKENAVYAPSNEDIAKGGCSMNLVVHPKGVCLSDTDATILMITPAPVIETVSEKYFKPGEAVSLVAKVKGITGNFRWSTQGTGTFSDNTKSETVYTPSPEEIKTGKVLLGVVFTPETSNCDSKRAVTLLVKKEKM